MCSWLPFSLFRLCRAWSCNWSHNEQTYLLEGWSNPWCHLQVRRPFDFFLISCYKYLFPGEGPRREGILHAPSATTGIRLHIEGSALQGGPEVHKGNGTETEWEEKSWWTSVNQKTLQRSGEGKKQRKSENISRTNGIYVKESCMRERGR